MAQFVKIPTYTIISATTFVYATTYYQDPILGDVLQCFINEQYQFIDNLPILEGRLVVIMKQNFPTQTELELETNGNLMIFGNEQEVEKYEINENGHLTYTTEI